MGYVVTAMLTAKPGREARLREVLCELAERSREEPGCRVYEVSRAVDDPRRFLVYERYVDVAAYRAHTDSEHYAELIAAEAAPRLLDSSDVACFEAIGDPPLHPTSKEGTWN